MSDLGVGFFQVQNSVYFLNICSCFFTEELDISGVIPVIVGKSSEDFNLGAVKEVLYRFCIGVQLFKFGLSGSNGS